MKISTPIEESGFFWLPGEQDKKVPGIFKVSELGKVTLETTTHCYLALPSSFHNPHFSDKNVRFKRILGVTKSGYVTLENCSVVNSNFNIGPDLASRIIQGDFAFMGVAYGEGQEITFSKISFFIEGLDEWLDVPVGAVDHEFQDNRIQVSITYSLPDKIVIPLSYENMELSFEFNATIPSEFDIKETKITQNAYVALNSKDARSLDDFLEVANRFYHFLCLAIGSIVPITSIIGYSDTLTRKGQNEKEYKIPIKIFYEDMPIPYDNLKIGRHNMLFAYNGVKNRLNTIINKWITNHKKFELAFNPFFAFHFKAYLYVEGQFLSLTQSVEALHGIKYKRRTCLRKRLEKMFEPFLKIYNKDDVHNDLIPKIVNARKFLAHPQELAHLQGDTRNLDTDLIRLFVLSEKLDALLQLHFLHMVGINVESLVRNNQNLRRKIECSEDDHKEN